MTLDKFVEGDILATCNALGTEISDTYVKGKHCIECLKDILRYLKRDTDDHAILRFLGSIRLLQTDLLPLIKRYDQDGEIFDFSLRILVAVTHPALLLYKEDVPDDKISRNVYLQIISHLQSYKKAFNDVSVWKIFYEHLKDLLKIRPVERSHNENVFIERIIILIRNVLHIPPDESVLKQTDDDLSLHDKILESLHESKINILLLYMAANEEEHKYCLHVLEVVSLMFREHNAETLASTNETRSASEKQKDMEVLLTARKREQSLKMQKIQSLCSSRFSGVYTVKNMKSVSDNDYISHKLITSTDDVKFDLQKNSRRKPKNRVRAPDVDNSRQSTLRVRLLLKKFCIEFLRTYNKMMVSVKRDLLRNTHNGCEKQLYHDDTYYLWAICYFMQFNRLNDFQPALVSETISVQSFHHIQTEITNYQEMMLTDKKKITFWAKRMQLGVSAYKELLETLRVMEKSQDEIIRGSADALISHVFYVIEYREMLLSLLSNYDEVKFPLSYLAKLVESTQIFLKMLENHSKNHSEIIVQKKLKKVRRKRKKKPAEPNEPVNVEEQLNEQWDVISSELSAAVEGRLPIPDVTPFDGASEMSFDEQKVEAVYKIRDAIIANKPFEAVGLLRAARELWPEGDSFGAADIGPEPEFLVLKEIHFSGLQRSPTESTSIEAEENYSEEEDEEMESQPSVAEQQLDINDVYKKYATYKVVYPCSLLLANYQNNKPQTNTCLIKLLHRIAWNCKMHALFFQSTIFLTFQKIFHDPDVSFNPVVKEFYRFAKFIVQKFFAAAQKNDKIFVELLFWKGPREAYELEEGYGASESKVKGWTEDEEEELKYLFDENKDIYIEGQDVADIILANLNTKKWSKSQIISALKRLDLIKSVKDLKPEKRKEWQEAEIVELQHLFEDYKNSEDIMGIILDKLSIKRSKKAVIDKLLELNLIADRKEVRKKTSKHSKKSKNSDTEGNTSDEDPVDDYEEETHFNSESSGDEAEINFFKNLEAERYADENGDSPHSENGISNVSDTKKMINKRSEVWDEQEIMELTTLFNENRESDNIMHVILNSLSKRRSKEAVINKLIELALIKNKKEIRKKKDHKAKKIDLLSFSKDSENENSDFEKSINKQKSKERKKLKRHILSDSDDDHNSTLKNLDETSDSVVKPKVREPKAWQEEEMYKLNQLFIEYKDSDDIMSDILSNLTIKRTKKNVIEKMLEIGLIKDKTEVKKKKVSNKTISKVDANNSSEKPKKKKQSALWEEQEIVELNQLYQSYKNSDDIMSNILEGLSVKRNKQNVVEKMLEIGLIQDKKEVRKKRTSKKLKAKQSLNEMSDSDNEDLAGRNMNSQTVTNKRLLSDSSDDESLPLSSITKKPLSDLSADESVPLSSILSSDVPQKEVESSILISSSLSSSKASVSDIICDSSKTPNARLHDLSYKGNMRDDIGTEETPHDTEMPIRSNKRKRLLINSDESSDDDAISTKELYIDNTLDQNNSTTDSPEKFQDNALLKKQKKKIRVLADSDDSD